MNKSRPTMCKLTARGLAYATLGISSLFLFALSVLSVFSPYGAYLAPVLFVLATGSGIVSVVLNARWLRLIADGRAGEYDLVCTWPGYFSACLSCLLAAATLLVIVVR
jgi:hypothetical protein